MNFLKTPLANLIFGKLNVYSADTSYMTSNPGERWQVIQNPLLLKQAVQNPRGGNYEFVAVE